MKMTEEEWRARGRELFGDDVMAWRFVCPSCGRVQTPAEYKAAGAPQGAVAFSCVSRYDKPLPEQAKDEPDRCLYAGGGLFKLNPVRVEFPDGHVQETFAFAEGQAA